MSKCLCFCLLFCLFFKGAKAAPPSAPRDSIVKILGVIDRGLREKQLVLYLRNYFSEIPVSQFAGARRETRQLLQDNHVADRIAINSFIEALCLARQQHFTEAEGTLIHTIALAEKSEDDNLLYACFTHLGFIQTYLGNIAEAVSNFRMAKKEAALLQDAYMQVVIDINISDIYYRINLSSQALFYLRQAQSLMAINHLNIPKTRNAIINNIAESYFRLDNIDSLKRYNRILNETKTGPAALYTYQQRTNYYLDLLKHDYAGAINSMQSLRTNSRFAFDSTDEQNLADAYFRAGQPDSAKAIISRLLADTAQYNHPEIKMHLYEVLGQIAGQEQNSRQTATGFKMALGQAKEQISRLTRVDTIASQIKIDEMQGAYIEKAESYKRERLWMGFIIIVTLLGLVIAALSYRHIKRKKYYEQLLFAAKKEELAFINSHEVRRHLSNIMGIIETIKQSKNRRQAYSEAEEHLLSAADNLDTAIKNISEKLDG